MPAIFWCCRKRRPTRLPKHLVGRLETGGHRHFAVLPMRANFIAIPVEWGDHFTDKLASFFQHLLHQIRIDFIKRVIGLPGDRLQMKHGRLFINGEMLPEEVVDTFHDLDLVEHTDKQVARFEETLPEGKKILILKETDEGYANNTPVFTVPEHHYFMMGDNRDNSQDSRFAEGVGFVPEANIVGRAEVILFSMNGEGQLWEFWKWMDSFRGDRFVKIIR